LRRDQKHRLVQSFQGRRELGLLLVVGRGVGLFLQLNGPWGASLKVQREGLSHQSHVRASLVKRQGVRPDQTNMLQVRLHILVITILQVPTNGTQIHGIGNDCKILGNAQLNRINSKQIKETRIGLALVRLDWDGLVCARFVKGPSHVVRHQFVCEGHAEFESFGSAGRRATLWEGRCLVRVESSVRGVGSRASNRSDWGGASATATTTTTATSSSASRGSEGSRAVTIGVAVRSVVRVVTSSATVGRVASILCQI